MAEMKDDIETLRLCLCGRGKALAAIDRIQTRVAEMEKEVQIEREWGLDLEKNCDSIERDRDSLRAKLERATGALAAFKGLTTVKNCTCHECSRVRHAQVVLSELSADAPAQQTPDLAAMQEAMKEAERALEPFAECARMIPDGYDPNYGIGRIGLAIDAVDLTQARAALASLRKAMQP